MSLLMLSESHNKTECFFADDADGLKKAIKLAKKIRVRMADSDADDCEMTIKRVRAGTSSSNSSVGALFEIAFDISDIDQMIADELSVVFTKSTNKKIKAKATTKAKAKNARAVDEHPIDKSEDTIKQPSRKRQKKA